MVKWHQRGSSSLLFSMSLPSVILCDCVFHPQTPPAVSIPHPHAPLRTCPPLMPPLEHPPSQQQRLSKAELPSAYHCCSPILATPALSVVPSFPTLSVRTKLPVESFVFKACISKSLKIKTRPKQVDIGEHEHVIFLQKLCYFASKIRDTLAYT